MQPSVHQIAERVAVEAGGELDAAMQTIKHCLEQLSDEQLWWRPAPSMNSIANLMLHVGGNVNQWIVSGIGGDKDTRNRPREFSERGPIERAELIGGLEQIVQRAKDVMLTAKPSQLLESRRIQSFETTGLGAIFHSVAHFRGHTQEIVHLARCQLGQQYRFAFVPATPEEGASC